LSNVKKPRIEKPTDSLQTHELGAVRTVQVDQGVRSAKVPLDENSIATLLWRQL